MNQDGTLLDYWRILADRNFSKMPKASVRTRNNDVKK